MSDNTPSALLSVLRLAISDPGSVLPRERYEEDWDGGTKLESVQRWGARAAAQAVAPFLHAGPKLDLEQWDVVIDALQQVADEDCDPDGGQRASDLAVLLRNEIDRLVPGTYGGCVRRQR